MKKPIKSPYVKEMSSATKSKHCVRNNNDLVETGKENLAKFLAHLDRLGVNIETAHIGGYFAGFQAGLLAIGLPKELTKKITSELLDEVERIQKDGCGKCDHCKANKKNKK